MEVGHKYKLTLIPGDGIGPEVIEATLMCISALGLDIEWEKVCVGQEALRKYGTPLPDFVLESMRKNKVALKGPVITPVGEGFRSVNVAIRKELDLYVCLRPTKAYKGARALKPNIDIVVIRENTEGLYVGIEFENKKSETLKFIEFLRDNFGINIRSDSGVSLKVISEEGSRRIIRFAFEYALKNNKKKVTCVHKANILKFSDGLFLKTFYKIASEYPEIQAQDIIIDNLCMQLVLNPVDFEVLVLPNLYGDIVSDLCAGLVGGLGVTPGANIGDEIAVFEPVHGAAPKFKGQYKVNPTAAILSAVMMLNYLGEKETAVRLERAVREVLEEGKFVTFDLKSDSEQHLAVSTLKMAEAICRKLQ